MDISQYNIPLDNKKYKIISIERTYSPQITEIITKYKSFLKQQEEKIIKSTLQFNSYQKTRDLLFSDPLRNEILKELSKIELLFGGWKCIMVKCSDQINNSGDVM